MKTTRRNLKKQQRRTRKQRKTRGGNLDAGIKNIVSRLIQDRENNQANMLNIACKNPDNCLALGVYGAYIKRYFDNFRNLSLVNRPGIKRIGNVSANGFIVELAFTKNGFRAYAALKCSAKESSDNLFYEYYVGKFFINLHINTFPCFVETYDCYTFNNKVEWAKLKNLTKNLDLTNMITRKPVSEELTIAKNNTPAENLKMFSRSCIENKFICVLIQHFDNFRSVGDEYEKNYDNIKYEILNILYQVYFPLTILKDVYTHYDLHSNNVFLYKPYEGKKYIQMRYNLLSGRVIEFPTEYIVKIIDYGRNFFDNGITNTKKILDDYVCSNTQCSPYCGADVGYSVIQGNEYDPNTDLYWIFPNKKNISHDLRFAQYLYDYLKQTTSVNTFVYDDREINVADSDMLYGTPEKLGGDAQNIYNIVNLRDCLETSIDSFNNIKINQKYDNTWKKVAVMNIYEDQRPYTYEVLPDTA